MKRIMDKLKGRQILLGVIIGVLLMGGAGYAVDNLTSESVSYTKGDKVMSVKQALDDLIGKAVKVDELEKQVADYQKIVFNLYDKVKEGDYVAYNAGSWEASALMPAEDGQFGGYTKGQSKNKSVACYEDSAPKYNGWRVLKKENDKVYLVHAGQPECYYFYNSPTDSTINNLNNKANAQYVNKTYADSAHMMTEEEANDIAESNVLRNIGTTYWLAYGGYDGSSSVYFLRYVEPTGLIGNTRGARANGLRPVVELKSGIQTTGKVKDEFNQEAWNLIAQ